MYGCRCVDRLETAHLSCSNVAASSLGPDPRQKLGPSVLRDLNAGNAGHDASHAIADIGVGLRERLQALKQTSLDLLTGSGVCFEPSLGLDLVDQLQHDIGKKGGQSKNGNCKELWEAEERKTNLAQLKGSKLSDFSLWSGKGHFRESWHCARLLEECMKLSKKRKKTTHNQKKKGGTQTERTRERGERRAQV